MQRRRPLLVALVVLAGLGVLAGLPRPAGACRVLEVELTPTKGLQIVIWLEDRDGNFVDTFFITQATGTYGLGNRPGIMEFNSEFRWPYGRRESLFPVWAHRRGVTYPRVVFQDEQDRDLSHAFTRSSPESFYCRPLRADEPTRQRSIDANSCATTAFTDKGKLEDVRTSLYPPRRDVTYAKGTDSPDVQRFAPMNDLDAVSRATPPAGASYRQAFSVPATVADGEYVAWIEVAKEFDLNQTYAFPAPQLVAYSDYGEPYRGQPSVLWKVPVIIDSASRASQAADYEGYGDPDGLDGRVRAPDPTISTGAEGSGAQRLLLATGDAGAYRFRVLTRPSDDSIPPGAPGAMAAVATSSSTARISFTEPQGQVRGFDVRIATGAPITAATFMTTGRPVSVTMTPAGAGAVQTFDLSELQPQTHYWVAIRAHDSCLNGGAPAVIELLTPRLDGGEVSACFVATAAFGSPMQAEVTVLRALRDQLLRRQALGELFVETYYTFGPALAGVIRPSDTLRALTRAALAPVVERARLLVE